QVQVIGEGELQACGPIGVDFVLEPLRAQPPRDEVQDPSLVVHQEDPTGPLSGGPGRFDGGRRDLHFGGSLAAGPGREQGGPGRAHYSSVIKPAECPRPASPSGRATMTVLSSA